MFNVVTNHNWLVNWILACYMKNQINDGIFVLSFKMLTEYIYQESKNHLFITHIINIGH